MGCFSNFFQGYKRTPRQECKIRASATQLSTNQSNDEYWKNREDYLEAVPSVSFSFGQGKDEGELSQELPQEDNNALGNGQDLYNPQGIATFDDNGSTLSRKSLNSSRLSDSVSHSGKSQSGKVVGSHEASGEGEMSNSELKQNESGHVHKDGDIEWMYQLNTLAKEHAKRNKGADGN